MKRAIAQGGRNPFKLKEFVDAGTKAVTLDDQLTINDVLGLGQRYRGFDPSDLKTYNLDVERRLGGRSAGRGPAGDAEEPGHPLPVPGQPPARPTSSARQPSRPARSR